MSKIGDGFVSRETVIAVLSRTGVIVTPVHPPKEDTFVLSKGDDILEIKYIPAEVGRNLQQYFRRTFSIPVHYFYHPEELLKHGSKPR